MALPRILRPNNKGFTLIEIVIVIAILAVIFSFGLFISFDFYKSYSFGSEKNVIVSILQKARNQSLNNINQLPHGVHFEASPSLTYTIFEGASFSSSSPNNIPIGASYNVTIADLPFDVIFAQLSATSTNRIITVTSNGKSYDITINSEGRIDW